MGIDFEFMVIDIRLQNSSEFDQEKVQLFHFLCKKTQYLRMMEQELGRF